MCQTPTALNAPRASGQSGFREMGWDDPVLEHQYEEHVTGWDFYLGRLRPYVADLLARR